MILSESAVNVVFIDQKGYEIKNISACRNSGSRPPTDNSERITHKCTPAALKKFPRKTTWDISTRVEEKTVKFIIKCRQLFMLLICD